MSETVQTTPWVLYMVECVDSTYYTGITTDIDRRLQEHNAGTGAKYTQSRRPVRLIYTEFFADRSSASKREHAVKTLTRAEKKRLLSCPWHNGISKF